MEVHYVGTLTADSSKFDSSRDRDDTFKFDIGGGQVIKGWDKGVATMKKGEKSILRCTSEYGYGASGSPPNIPGGASLDFEVELFGWEKVCCLSIDFSSISSDARGLLLVIAAAAASTAFSTIAAAQF